MFLTTASNSFTADEVSCAISAPLHHSSANLVSGTAAWELFLRDAYSYVGGASALAGQSLMALMHRNGSMPQPKASVTEEATLFISWRRAEHYLQAEISADGTIQWFYLNFETNEKESGREFPLSLSTSLKASAAKVANTVASVEPELWSPLAQQG